MNRRRLLVSAAAVAGTGGAIWWAGRTARVATGQMPEMNMSGGTAALAERIRDLPIGAPLPEFVRLGNTSSQPGMFEAVIEAGLTNHEFKPGVATPVLAYNGALPGAMIDVVEGDRFKATFRNRIPDQPSTIHWHGLEIPADQDGNPMDPIESGAERIYEFTVPIGTAGSYWYHPHPHGLTAEQVYRGLAGPFIVRAKSDPLPAELGDTILFVTAVSLDAGGTIAENTEADKFNGREGDHVLVNGVKQPVLTLPPGSSRRFRVYNATNGRFLRLAFEGHEMTLVGTDGGLLAAPVKGLKELLLASAERAEIVVDFRAEAGRVALVSLPYERGWMGGGKPAPETLSLMTVTLDNAAVSPIALPARLRDIPALGEPVARKRIELGENMGMANGAMTMGFLIDGKSFDMNRVDLRSRVGEVELWEIFNATDMDHPTHIHGTQFQIVERERGGRAVSESFLAWKDSINIASKETVRIKVRQTMPGRRMYHCHILEHENAGMMGMLDVA
ncbi:MAG: multicopper oxidase family protein [Aestuariivirga sp.]